MVMQARSAEYFGIGVLVAITLVVGAVYAQPFLVSSAIAPAQFSTTTFTVNVAQPNCGNPCTIILKNSNFVVLNTTSNDQSSRGTGATSPTPSEVTFTSGTFGNNSMAVVQIGTKVTWLNDGPDANIIASNSWLLNPVPLVMGQSFAYTFNSTGTYEFQSQVNPMSGVIVVISG